MKKIEFPIVGLRHHYYKNTLRSLYRKAVGMMVYISIDRENVVEPNAVVAYLEGNCLGYVRTGENRAMACAALEASEYGVLMCKVVRIDSELREIWVELVVNDHLMTSSRTTPDVLAGWNYGGQVLLWDAEVQRLQNQAGALMAQLACDPQEWTTDMETALCVVEECGWADISGTFRHLLLDMVVRLTKLSSRNEAFYEASRRVQYTIDYLCSPEWQERRVEALRQLSQSRRMEELQQTLGTRAVAVASMLPAELCALYDRNPAEAIGRLCYLRKDRLMTEEVLTVLALRQHLLDLGMLSIEEGELMAVPSDPIRTLLADLLAARDAEGALIFSERRQWYAVYRVLKDVRSYPSLMTDFCQRMRDMGMDRVSVPCIYDSFRKVATDLPKLKADVKLWKDYAHISDGYKQQCIVVQFLLEKLGIAE